LAAAGGGVGIGTGDGSGCSRERSSDNGGSRDARCPRVGWYRCGRLGPRIEEVILCLLFGSRCSSGFSPIDNDPVGEPNKRMVSLCEILTVKDETDRATSSLTRRASSSLYNSPTRLEYFFFVSTSLNNDDTPCLVKKSPAKAFPPTFIVRNWASCQLSRLVDLYKLYVKKIILFCRRTGFT
jgi:hypothetical protein